jgi:intein/homing endonuclease
MDYKLKQNTKYEIMTPTGFRSFSGMRSLTKNSIFKIKLSNGKKIECSDNHPFMLDGIKTIASELKIGSKISSTNNSYVTVLSIEYCNKTTDLYDIVEVDGGNIFNVDGIISHNCDFISSGYTIVDGSVLEWYKETHVTEPIEKRGFDANYWIWDYPNYSKDYIVVADVARGDGADYSAFHVIDVERLEQVAEYKGKIETKQYGAFLSSVAAEWNNALLVIENANIGWAVIQEVIDRNYGNLYYSYRELGYIDEDIHLRRGWDLKQKEDMVPGFSMTQKTRPLIVSKLDTYMREKSPIIHSKRLLDELFVFIWNGSKAEAQRGYNDDLVISFSTGLWVRDTAMKLRQQGMNLTRNALSSITRVSGNQITVFSSKNSGQNPYIMKDIRGNDVDLGWLF